MKIRQYFLLIICSTILFFTSNNAAAQILTKNDSMVQYDKAYAESLKKEGKRIEFQKTEKRRRGNVKSEPVLEEKRPEWMKGLLLKNEDMIAFDHEFAEALRSVDWKELELVKSTANRLRNKPEIQPAMEEDYKQSPDRLVSRKTTTSSFKSYQLNLGNKYKNIFSTPVNVHYYGWKFPVYYDEKIKEGECSLTSVEYASHFWKQLADSQWDVFLEQVSRYANRLELKIGDWGYVLLMHEIGKRIYSDKNANTVFTWFMLNHSGRICKLAKDSNADFYLLFATEDEILGTDYDYESDTYYYDLYKNPVDLSKKDIEVSPFAFEPPNVKMRKIRSFSSSVPEVLSNSSVNEEKKFIFSTEKTTYAPSHSFFSGVGNRYNEEIYAYINPYRVQYYKDVPTTTLKAYFESSCYVYKNEDFMDEVSYLLEDRNTYIDKVNLLLDFTSSDSAFEYKADDRPLFPDKTLDDTTSDCEDRAVLFAGLAQHLLQVKVLGIEYSDHVIVAIPHKPDPLFDDSAIQKFTHGGKTYVLCDPTADNARYGRITPKYKNLTYRVIDFGICVNLND